MNFQKIILIGAVGVLVIILLSAGIATRLGSNEQWPPVVSYCPDYWSVAGTKDKPLCVDSRKLSKCPNQGPMDFNAAPYDDAINGVCAKSTWAKACGVSWDAVTYGVNDPCV